MTEIGGSSSLQIVELTLGRNPDRQCLVSLDEAGIDPLRLADHLDAVETLGIDTLLTIGGGCSG